MQGVSSRTTICTKEFGRSISSTMIIGFISLIPMVILILGYRLHTTRIIIQGQLKCIVALATMLIHCWVRRNIGT